MIPISQDYGSRGDWSLVPGSTTGSTTPVWWRRRRQKIAPGLPGWG